MISSFFYGKIPLSLPREDTMTDIRIKHFPEIEIRRGDLILEITGKDGQLGHLYISKSSLDFLPRNKKHNTVSLTWEKFVNVMEKVDKKRQKKKKAARQGKKAKE